MAESLIRRIIVYLSLFLVFAFFQHGTAAAEGRLVVTIQGIDGILYDNVEASLSIAEKKDDLTLSARQIQRLHEDASQEIREALEPFGYYSPIIEKELRQQDGSWQASYAVSIGEPVLVEKVDIRLLNMETVPPAFENIMQQFPLAKGAQLDHSLYKKGKKTLLKKFFARGYVKAGFVSSRIEVSRVGKSCSISLVIDPGPLFYFGETVYDQELLAPGLLQRFLNYRKGEPFSIAKLLRLQQILYRTNYFSRVVVKGDIDSADGVYVPVIIRLSEPEFRNRYSFGLGYATDDGVRGKVGWENRLFNSKGHNISSEIKVAQRESSFDLNYGIPVNDPRYDRTILGVAYNEETWDDTDTNLFKGGISYEHGGSQYKYGGGFEIRDEKYEVGVTKGESTLTVPFVHWSMVYGDSYINTSNGLFISLNVKGTVEDAFSDTTFLQTLLSGKVITTPFEGLRIIGKFSLGATVVDSIDDLPPSLRFYAGGDQSVRGYGFRELGPKDESGTVVGGRYLLLGSLEAEKSLYNNWSGAVFLDTGNGVNDLTDDLAQGVGIGLRYKLPFGQIRVDLASAVSEEDNPLRFHITVGGDL